MRFGGTMAIDNRVRRFTRTVFGSEKDQMICKVSWGYTEVAKKAVATSNTYCMAATTMGLVAVDYVPTSLGGNKAITQPDVPRVLIVKPAGTAGDVGAGVVVITGTNVEGATISENFALTDASTTAITGKKAFKSITKVHLPSGDGGFAGTISVGVGNALGLYHRLFPNNTTVKVVKDDGTTRSLDTTPAITNADEKHIEENTITPATVPTGLLFYHIYYIYDHWTLGDLNGNPDWSTSTSTSTSSTSTSTTTSLTTTSTSSTSMSTSSTSRSTSSTSMSTSSTSRSTSTSSTSTSTTTTP
jgi:hypothetical protein